MTMSPILNLDSTVNYLPGLPSMPTIPSVPDLPPLEAPPELFVAANQPPNGRAVNNRVFNYYFLFLALFTGVLAALFWWLHHQRRREREQTRSSGHVEGWAFNRRNQLPHIEGLNEAGEAPPPYMSKIAAVTTQDSGSGLTELGTGVTRPPRALSQGQIEHDRLPHYLETVRIGCDLSVDLARPAVQFVSPHPGSSAT
ncbi:hypothetical protein EKO04_001290 [Ascochyta lentis]|uniref:Uncharacterized protein n=1 Tax=Ascochyta lentis TaxID=205686 RepID=A0A8H7MLI8_9PLEO|nr:hypothetical protein EKO04_001290 [Ascochyta lentis]